VPRTEDSGTTGVAALAARYGLPDAAREQLEVLLDLLVEDPLAPTAIRDRRAAVDDHLADSLVALDLAEVRRASSVVDLGSGAGLPALVLAIALPRVSVVAVESSQRKCAFLERAVTACRLEHVEVIHARVEAWPEGLGRFELATARALASLEAVTEYAAPLLTVGGTLVAWRGKRDRAAEHDATRAAPALGMAVGPVLAVTPYEGAQHRHLHLMSKVMDTPERFPRRPGVALKRPLSGLSGPS
jgi:16S rRNA (guanine527-N7)-methyltransferase